MGGHRPAVPGDQAGAGQFVEALLEAPDPSMPARAPRSPMLIGTG
jgi:hypothetical protein